MKNILNKRIKSINKEEFVWSIYSHEVNNINNFFHYSKDE